MDFLSPPPLAMHDNFKKVAGKNLISTRSDREGVRSRIGIDYRNLAVDASRQRIARSLAAAWDLPVMAVPPTHVRTGGSTTSITNFTFYSDATPEYWSYGPIATSNISSYQRPTNFAAAFWTIAFYTDAAEFEILEAGANSQWHVKIDGQYYSATPFTENAGSNLHKFTFADKRVRLVEISGQNLQFGGVYTNGLSGRHPCWPGPSQFDLPLLAMMSDSYGVGVGSSVGNTFVDAMGRVFGCNTWANAVSSTGWLTAGIAATRISAISQLLYAPDVLGIAFGYNDNAGDKTLIGPVYAQFIDGIRALGPNWLTMPIWTFGPWTPQGTTPQLTDVKNALIAACAAKGTTYIDTEGIVTAANKQDWTGGDLVHPNGPSGATRWGVGMAYAALKAGLVPVR